MQFAPGARAGTEFNQAHAFAAVAEREHEQTGATVFASCRGANQRDGAVVDLGFFVMERVP